MEKVRRERIEMCEREGEGIEMEKVKGERIEMCEREGKA